MDTKKYDLLTKRSIDYNKEYWFEAVKDSVFVDIFKKKVIYDGHFASYDLENVTSINCSFISESLINEIAEILTKIRGRIIYDEFVYDIATTTSSEGSFNLFTGETEYYYRVPSKIFNIILKDIFYEDTSFGPTISLLNQLIFNEDYDIVRELICECGNSRSKLRDKLNISNSKTFDKFVYDKKFDEIIIYKNPASTLGTKMSLKQFYEYFRSNVILSKDNSEIFKFNFQLTNDPLITTDNKSSIIQHIGIDEFNLLRRFNPDKNYKKIASYILEKYEFYLSEFLDKKIYKTKIIVDEDNVVTVKVKYK